MMAIEVFWGSGSPAAWRVLLALEYKRLPYVSHVLQFSKQEHKSPQLLALNPRGRVPVLRDGEYVCFESLAILYYLDLKYPQPPIFGRTPEEAGTIMRVGALQDWPELLNTCAVPPLTAFCRSASSRMMFGDLPPSSWLTRLTVLAARLATSMPARVEPVNEIMSMPG